jgi:predicted dehydrogenase
MRFAVVGSGGWAGKRHVEALNLLGHEIVALVDPFPGCAEQARAVGARALASFEELDLDSIDAATLALPPHLHPALTETLAKAGKHVMCEKPMAPDSREARRLADFASSCRVTIMPGYLLRCNPHIRGFKDQLDSMGTLRRVHLSTNVRKPSMSGWRSEPEIGGALLVNAIHQLDLATWFVGERLSPRIALLDNVHHLDAATEDYFYTSLTAPSGCAASVLSSWSPHPPVCLDGLMITDAGRLRIEAETDTGSMVLTATGYRVNDKDVALEGVVGVNQFAKELEHFVDAIENGTPLWVTPEDNYLVQKLIEDCRAAAASKPLPSAKVA